MRPPRARRAPAAPAHPPQPAAAREEDRAGPDPDRPQRPDDAVEVAVVLGAWGVKGGIRVKPHSSVPEALFSSKRWYVEPAARASLRPDSVAPVRPLPTLLSVIQAREQGDVVVATCRELADRDQAAALAGCRLFVSRASFPTPSDNEYYWVDLIGLDVVDRSGRRLGTVSHLIETGPHCVLCIDAPAGQADTREAPLMIPFVDAYVDRVDRETRTIHVDWALDS